jgi:hypothetical protein
MSQCPTRDMINSVGDRRLYDALWGPIRKTGHSTDSKNRLTPLEELRVSDTCKKVLRNEASAVGFRNVLETIG